MSEEILLFGAHAGNGYRAGDLAYERHFQVAFDDLLFERRRRGNVNRYDHGSGGPAG